MSDASTQFIKWVRDENKSAVDYTISSGGVVKLNGGDAITFVWDKEAYREQQEALAKRAKAFNELYNSDYFIKLAARSKRKGNRRFPRARRQ